MRSRQSRSAVVSPAKAISTALRVNAPAVTAYHALPITFRVSSRPGLSKLLGIGSRPHGSGAVMLIWLL
jgi:hypothetical protein